MKTAVLCGSHEPRIWCVVQDAIEAALLKGGLVERFTADEWDGDTGLSGLTQTKGSSRLVIIQGDPGYAVKGAIIVPAGGKVPKWASDLPKGSVKTFDLPKPWEEETYAVKYCMAEAERRGCVISETIAEMLVRRVGTDVCVLRMEIRKLHLLLGSQEVDVGHLQNGVEGVDESSRFLHALGMRDAEKLHRALAGMPKDTGRLLSLLGLLKVTLLMWLSASLHRMSGRSSEEIAEKLGVHPYRYGKQVQPYLLGWEKDRLIGLMQSLGEVERGCKEGAHVSPWVEFEAILYRHISAR